MKTLKILGIFLQLKWQETFGLIQWHRMLKGCLDEVVAFFVLAIGLPIYMVYMLLISLRETLCEFKSWIVSNWKKATGIVEGNSIIGI